MVDLIILYGAATTCLLATGAVLYISIKVPGIMQVPCRFASVPLVIASLAYLDVIFNITGLKYAPFALRPTVIGVFSLLFIFALNIILLSRIRK